MLAAWKWIKLLAVGTLCITVWVLWLKLDASQLKQVALAEKLNRAKADNVTNLSVINTLQSDADKTNQLFVRRKQEQIEAEGKLNAEMDKLKKEMESIDCHIPADVTERLREPY